MTFVVTDGQLAAIGDPIQTYSAPTSTGVYLSSGISMTYGALYRCQPAIRMVVDFLARNIASLNLHSFERVDDLDRVRLAPADSPLARLLEERPNPTTTAYRLIHALISDRAIYDAAYWLKVKDTGGRTLGVRRIPANRVSPIGGDWFEVTDYRITGSRGYLDRPAAEFVVFPGYDPEDTRRGVSPIETLRAVLAEESAATDYRAQLWRNGARTGGVITRPPDAPEWGKTARRRFLAEWNSQFTGEGPQAGGTPILEDGMAWVASGVTPKEAQYVESRKLTREEAASSYHIPPPLVGILDHATFSNISEQHVQLYVDTLGPWLNGTEQEIILQLVPEFYLPGRRVYVEFNIGAKLKGNFEQQAAQLQAAVGGPYMTRNEARARLNLPQVEGADELIVPMNVTSGGLASPQDTAPPPPGTAGRWPAGKSASVKAAASDDHVRAHIDALTAFFGRQQRSITSKVKARKAAAVELADVWDRARWDRELSADLYALALPTTAAVGTAVMLSVGESADAYDPGMTEHYLAAQTVGVASGVNGTTEQQLAVALSSPTPGDAVAALFALALAQRAAMIGRSQATALAGWSSTEAGRQLGRPGTVKRWITGPNPRKSHQVMNGETVDIDGKFSNGARWPADAIDLSVDEVAGCNCSLEIIPGGTE